MAGWVRPDLLPKLVQVRSNLKNWKPLDWLLFWIIVPAALFLVYALPQPVKDDWFVLNTVNPWSLQAWFLSSYTHSQLSPHLIGNLAFYLVVLFMIFAFENNRRRFRDLALWSFLAVPFVSSLLTILFWGFLGRTTTGQGFSAIVGALLAYAMFVFVVWGTQDRPEVFDNPALFAGEKGRFSILRVLLGIILVLIVVMGLISGIFTDAGGSVVNGIAHFGGFISSLMVLLVLDIRIEKRRYFDAVLGCSILVGIVFYGLYLANLVRIVNGG